MKHTQSTLLATLLALCGILLFSVGVVVAGGYGLSSPDATAVPETTVDDPETGDEYTIDSFAVVDPGETVQVDVTAPDNEFDRVELRNSDNQIVDTENSESPIEFEINSATPPGSYSLLLWGESNRQAVLPLVVSGYDVTTTQQDVAENEDVEIDVKIEPAELTDEPAGAEVVVWNDETAERTSATLEQTTDGSYTDTVSLGTLDAGEYNVYAIAQGEDQFQGEDEILAISDESTLTVGVDSSNGDDDTGDDSSGDGSSDTDGDGAGGDTGSGLPSPPPITAPPEDVTLLTDTQATLRGGDEVSVAEFGGFLDEQVIERATFNEPGLDAELRARDFDRPPESTGSPPGEALSTTEIRVPQEFTDYSATLRFNLRADQHNVNELSSDEVDELTVWHHKDGQWDALPTEVIEQTDDGVTLDTQTDGFSYFVITDTSEAVADDDSADDDSTDTAATDDSVPGFGIFSVLGATLTVVMWTVLRKQEFK